MNSVFEEYLRITDIAPSQMESCANALLNSLKEQILHKRELLSDKDVQTIVNEQERIYVCSCIEGNEYGNNAYYFGMIQAYLKLYMFLIKNKTTNALLSKADAYPRLTECVLCLGQYGSLTGRELRKRLSMKNRSALSNLMKRQQVFSYIESHHVGNDHVYTLTKTGMEYYLQCRNSKPATMIDESGLISIVFDCIIQSLNDDNDIEFLTMSTSLYKRLPSLQKYLYTDDFSKQINRLSTAINQSCRKRTMQQVKERISHTNLEIQEMPLLYNEREVFLDQSTTAECYEY